MKKYEIGRKECMAKTITERDICLFAGVTGDFNPAHMDAEWAKESVFGERIAHGMLTAGLISAVIGMKLPGPGTIYLEQEAKFLRPVKIGDTITAEVEIAEVLKEEKGILRLHTRASSQRGEQVLAGYAVVKAP